MDFLPVLFLAAARFLFLAFIVPDIARDFLRPGTALCAPNLGLPAARLLFDLPTECDTTGLSAGEASSTFSWPRASDCETRSITAPAAAVITALNASLATSFAPVAPALAASVSFFCAAANLRGLHPVWLTRS
jgi:hypothetical protein